MRLTHALPSPVVAISLLLSALLVTGCGQKGPLYLPQDDNAAVPVDNSGTGSKPELKPESRTDAAQQ